MSFPKLSRLMFVLCLSFFLTESSAMSASVFSKDIGAPVKARVFGSGYAVQPEISNRAPVGTSVIDYSVTPAPTGSFITALTVADDFNQLQIFDSSGFVLTLRLTYPDTTTALYSIEPGGPGLTPIGAPSGTVIAVKSAGVTAVTGGLLILNALK